MMVLSIACLAFLWVLKSKPAWFSKLKPVDITEAEVRASLEVFADPHATNMLKQAFDYGFTFCLVLPPTNFFTPSALSVVRREVLRFAGFDPSRDLQSKLGSLKYSGPLMPALMAGWITMDELGVTAAEAFDYLHHFARDQRRFLLGERRCNDAEGEYTVSQFDNLTLARLRWLEQIHCLDLLDRSSLIAYIRSLQVLSENAAGIRASTHNWRGVRGLFYTSGWPVLQDTYRDLVALQILGGLDEIDKKACVDAILRLHHGKGFFAPPDIEESWEFKIDGSASDTFCAFESLRILGALDRVHDLPEWKFGPWYKSDPREHPRQITWNEVEAWLSDQMLAKIVDARGQ
jgi:hypothetical protein